MGLQVLDRKAAKQAGIAVVDEEQKFLDVIDVTIPANSNIRKKGVSSVEGATGADVEGKLQSGPSGNRSKLKERPQQYPNTRSEVSVQRSTVLGTASQVEGLNLRTLHLPHSSHREN